MFIDLGVPGERTRQLRAYPEEEELAVEHNLDDEQLCGGVAR